MELNYDTYYLAPGDKPGTPNPFRFLILIIAGLALLAMVTGCKPVANLSTLPPSHNRDSVRVEYRHDSVYIDRWHTRYVQGDTVFVRDSVWRDRFRTIRDTLRISMTDTIYQQVEVPVIQKVERSPFLRNSGIALWVILALAVLSVVVGIIIKVAK